MTKGNANLASAPSSFVRRTLPHKKSAQNHKPGGTDIEPTKHTTTTTFAGSGKHPGRWRRRLGPVCWAFKTRRLSLIHTTGVDMAAASSSFAVATTGSSSSGGGSDGSSPYLNNAERVFNYTIDYEVLACLCRGLVRPDAPVIYHPRALSRSNQSHTHMLTGRGQAAPGDSGCGERDRWGLERAARRGPGHHRHQCVPFHCIPPCHLSLLGSI